MKENFIYEGDCLEVLKTLPDNCIDCCVTSPPYYGLRNYGHDKQLGMEETPELFVQNMVAVFSEVNRVLKKEATLWLNMGDSYSGSGRGLDADGSWNPGDGTSKQGTNRYNKNQVRKINEGSLNKDSIESGAIGNKWVKPTAGYKAKDLIGVPWMLAFALRSDGWYLRQDIIWNKPNPMPESVTDRCTKAHEYIFLMSKSAKYYYDHEAIKVDSLYPDNERTSKKDIKRFPTELVNGIRNRKDSFYLKANKRSVWSVVTSPFPEAHFATFPEDLIVDCIKAGCPENGIVLDPFMGAGTTGLVASKLNRKYVGIELNPAYIKIAENRIAKAMGLFHKQA